MEEEAKTWDWSDYSNYLLGVVNNVNSNIERDHIPGFLRSYIFMKENGLFVSTSVVHPSQIVVLRLYHQKWQLFNALYQFSHREKGSDFVRLPKDVVDIIQRHLLVFLSDTSLTNIDYIRKDSYWNHNDCPPLTHKDFVTLLDHQPEKARLQSSYNPMITFQNQSKFILKEITNDTIFGEIINGRERQYSFVCYYLGIVVFVVFFTKPLYPGKAMTHVGKYVNFYSHSCSHSHICTFFSFFMKEDFIFF
jgi:hypothetical protein